MKHSLFKYLTGTFVFILLAAGTLNATHNRAGEITYEHVSGLTYRITITTCTKTSAPADRDTLEIDWGDGSPLGSIPRDNIYQIPGYDAQMNTYTETHTYPGAGTYILSMEDPNRNSGVLNIPNSVSRSFCIRSELNINPFSNSPNNSVQFTNRACNELACVDKTYLHNVGAYDPDGDSLTYELVECRGTNCQVITGYDYPDECSLCGSGPANNMSIDPITGTLKWDAPQVQGEYNVAIKVHEWRNGQHRGFVVRDMQIKVVDCDDEPPEIDAITDTCVLAGTNLTLDIKAVDPDSGEQVSLQATGEPMVINNSPANFPQGVVSSDSVTGTFQWQTNCGHVRESDYQVVFEARDAANPVALVDIHSLFIKVVAPAPKNPSATPSGNSLVLEWDKTVCDQDAVGYKIYRRKGTYGFTPSHCETGVPGYTGYQLIAETNSVNDTDYVDNDVVHGQEYCYMVTAKFPDGAESYASKEFCGELIKDVPIITHVSVGSTDVSTGIDTIRWAKPTEIDTVNQYPGPYQYRIYRGDGYNNAPTLIGSSNTSNSLALTDTTFIDKNIDTETGPKTYQVELYSGSTYVGETNTASSIYLSFVPNDEQLLLEWNEEVPWTNNQYEVYKQNTSTGNFNLLGTTTKQEFLDTGLVNQEEYCYYVKSIGSYSASGLVDPIINYSQIGCGVPEDRTPPCSPTLEVDAQCEQVRNFLTWNNPNNSCAEDVKEYNIYYSPLKDQEVQYVTTVSPHTDTTLYHQNDSSIAGCYAVSAVDSSLNANESELSDTVCVDNCPIYELPNVFSPNQDGQNDLFGPFPYMYVEKVDMTIYNRWGQPVYKTQDPDIDWSGKHMNSGEPVPEGVYYYVCKVYEIHVTGLEVRELKGTVQLLRNTGKNIDK